MHSIQNNSPSPSPSPLSKITNSPSTHNPNDIPSAEGTNNNNSKDSNTFGNLNSKNGVNKSSAESSTGSSTKSKYHQLTGNSSPQIEPLQFPKSNINVYLFNKLLDQPNLIDEINLSKNQKLINYLSQKDVINTMFEYILFSMKLSKYSNASELPTEYLTHDIFVSSTSSFDHSANNSNDDFLENTSTNNDNNDTNENINDSETNENENENGNENENEDADKLQSALQRATVISEIMILPNSNIHQTLLTNFDIFTTLWRGFMNNDPRFYFKNIKLIETPDDDKPAYNITGLETSPFESDIKVDTTDLQKLSELEESNNYISLRDSHEIIMFNNFLKFVDDLALINIGGFMNFIRFEQEYNCLTDQFVKFIPYSQTVCDLLVRLISTDKPYNSNGLITILIDQHLILNLLKICKKYYLDHQVQDNVCNLLNGIVGISSNIGFWEDHIPVNNNGGNNQDEQPDANNNNPNIGPNDLTRQLVSQECTEEMLDIILTHGNYGLVTIVSVIIEVIRKNNSDYDEFDWISSVNFNDENKSMPSSRDPIYLGNLLKLFSLNLDKIVQTYLTDGYYDFKKLDCLNSSIGHKIEPLGYERFKIMELIAELLHCSNMILMNKSIELDKLIYKRDSLRDIKKTEQLVSDAINGLIINNDVRGEDDEANDNDRLSLKSTSTIPYIEIPLELSVGNFFKYQLLTTNAIPLITLKLVKFPWNNFMHNVIFDLIQQIFNGRLANWDEDRAVNQEETIFDDNLSLNKILIWSLFGNYSDFFNGNDNDDSVDISAGPTFYKDYECKDKDYPGYFNLSLFIVYSYKLSNKLYKASNFRFGYMGHLTLIAEEIHKFQSYVENFGLTKNENAFGLHKEAEDDIRPFYLKSSYFIFNELYESIFEHKGDFQPWLDFVNSELREISSMYNKVLGNPNEIEAEMTNQEDSHNFEKHDNQLEESSTVARVNSEENENTHLGLSSEQVMANLDIQDTPKARNAIILDNGDSDEFRESIGDDEKDVGADHDKKSSNPIYDDDHLDENSPSETNNDSYQA